MGTHLSTQYLVVSLAGVLLFLSISLGSTLLVKPEQTDPSPSKSEVEPWLASFTMGPETVTFSWKDGLFLRVDRIQIPVDGRWHETFSTFGVRQRAFWVPSRKAIGFQEQHNFTALSDEEGVNWEYEYRLDADSRHLLKIARNGGGEGKETVVRKYVRKTAESAP